MGSRFRLSALPLAISQAPWCLMRAALSTQSPPPTPGQCSAHAAHPQVPPRWACCPRCNSRRLEAPRHLWRGASPARAYVTREEADAPSSRTTTCRGDRRRRTVLVWSPLVPRTPLSWPTSNATPSAAATVQHPTQAGTFAPPVATRRGEVPAPPAGTPPLTPAPDRVNHRP